MSFRSKLFSPPTVAILSAIYYYGVWFYLRWIPGRILINLIICFYVGITFIAYNLHNSSTQEVSEACKVVDETSRLIDESDSSNKISLETNGSNLRNRKNKSKDKVVAKAKKVQPKTQSTLSSNLLCLNFILTSIGLLLSLDFTFSHRFLYPERNLTFSRVTYIDTGSANVFVRIPEPISVQIKYSKSLEAQANYSSFMKLIEEDDFTSIFRIEGLDSDTKYNYEVVYENQTSILTGLSFTTLPQAQQPHRPLFFLSGSCIKPNYPYTFPSFLNSNNRVRGMQVIWEKFYNSEFQPLDLILFLGDFIYSDVPYYYGSAKKVYLKFYRQLYADPYINKLVQKTPMYHAYDDHEIVNNWSSHLDHPFLNAITAYTNYQGSGPYLVDSTAKPFTLPESYFSFQHGNVSFFVLDTRRYRSPSKNVDDEGKTMLGRKQLQEVIAWAKRDTGKVKFIASSVPLTINWDFFESIQDTWRGYQTERLYLLQQLRDTKNLFFLSGDRHEVSVTKLPYNFLEFSLSPINQFFSPSFLPAFEVFQTKPQIDTDNPSPLPTIDHYDPTLLYYRFGNIKFGTLYVDTSAVNPLLVVSVYSDIPNHTHQSYHLDHTVIKDSQVQYKDNTPVISNFEFAKEQTLEEYRKRFVDTVEEKEVVKPILHIFLKLER